MRPSAKRFSAAHPLPQPAAATDIRVVDTALDVDTLQAAVDGSRLGIFDFRLESDGSLWSARTCAHLGLPSDAPARIDSLVAAVHPEDRERVRQTLQEALDGAAARIDLEFRTLASSGMQECWVTAKGQLSHDEQGRPARFVGTTMDVTARKLAEQRIREAAQHDSLTGLPNRALLFEYCSQLIAMSERMGTGSGALLFIDLDRFKPINDLYGHEVGDKVLQEVARRLVACTRKEDIVSRLGGDEFVVVLPRIDGGSGPAVVAGHILEAVGQPIRIGEQELSVSPSIGISLFPVHSQDLETLIRCADLAMYAAKRDGRNTFRIYTPGHDDQANHRLRLEIKLKQALRANGMALYYQPIVELVSGDLIGAEALIRLPGEDGELLGPDEFIPVAESAGLMNDLGAWVASEACRQHQAWRSAGLPALSIAINISAFQFRQRTFSAQVARALEESGIDPACLQVEVTESAVMDNLPQTMETLNELRAMGVRIALDDFGTGYSSLSSLTSLPLDKLKIDQSFISRIDSNEPSRSIAEAIIALGRSLNLTVVGEGIESEGAMDYLRSQGCDQAQGYLLSKPLPAAEFESWCREHLRQRQDRIYH